jgi:hypothetical protein
MTGWLLGQHSNGFVGSYFQIFHHPAPFPCYLFRANVPGKCAPVAWNHLVDDAEGIGPYFLFDGKRCSIFHAINFRTVSCSSADDPKCSIAVTFVSGNIKILTSIGQSSIPFAVSAVMSWITQRSKTPRPNLGCDRIPRMPGDVDDLTIDILCPCGHQFAKSIMEIKTHAKFVCPECGQDFKSTDFEPAAQKAEKPIDDPLR